MGTLYNNLALGTVRVRLRLRVNVCIIILLVLHPAQVTRSQIQVTAMIQLMLPMGYILVLVALTIHAQCMQCLIQVVTAAIVMCI